MRFGIHLMNIMSILFVFSLFLLLDVPKSCIATDNFNHLKLVQQWPKGFCEYQKMRSGRQCRPAITIPKDKFTIHGLWPQTATEPQPINCNTSSTLLESVSISHFVRVRMSLFYIPIMCALFCIYLGHKSRGKATCCELAKFNWRR